jgi:8-oxo-dGTP diphosphatase
MKLHTLCYVEQDGKYLMLHRNKRPGDVHEGKWVGLGGKFEPGESPEECVVREVFEESGLRITAPRLRGILTFPEFSQSDWYVFLFTATEFTGELTAGPEGELAWVDKSALAGLPMYEGDHYFLRWLDEYQGVFSAKFLYEAGKYVGHKLVVYDERPMK